VDDDPTGVSANRQKHSSRQTQAARRKSTANNFTPPINRFAAFQR
jgi:hypothetical protein